MCAKAQLKACVKHLPPVNPTGDAFFYLAYAYKAGSEAGMANKLSLYFCNWRALAAAGLAMAVRSRLNGLVFDT
jgi:hypothetical protein